MKLSARAFMFAIKKGVQAGVSPDQNLFCRVAVRGTEVLAGNAGSSWSDADMLASLRLVVCY